MIENFASSLLFTLKEEGGFSDDAHDPGGATMKGITLTEFREYFGVPTATAVDLQNISDVQVSNIYQNKYWNGVQADSLPAGVDLSVFDMGVNAGMKTSIKILQRELAVKDDGVLGEKTMAAVNRQVPATLIAWLETGQARYYRSLSTFRYFGRGWINRTMARQNAALALLPPANAVKADKAMS
jgi:lysozyme family protein